MEAMISETSMDTGYPNRSKSASIVALLAGLWFLASPWVYGAYLSPESWNNRIVGLLITVLAIVRLSTADLKRTQWISWTNGLLAMWIVASPWVYRYVENTDRLVNSVCVGVILFIAAMISAVPVPKLSNRRSPREGR